MFKNQLWVGFIIACIVLTGCATTENANSDVATPASIATATLLPIDSAIAVATETPSPTVEATPIVEPTYTPTFTFSPTTEATPIVEPTYTPTYIPLPTSLPPSSYPPPIVETPDPVGFTLIELPSPDGNLVATIWYDTEPNVREIIFSITNLATGEQVVLERLTSSTGNMIPKTPYPLEWSANSQSLYYSYRPSYWDGCMTVLDSTLRVYDRLTDEHRLLLEGDKGQITFSPNRERMVYLPYLPVESAPTIAVYDFTTETLREAPAAAPDTQDALTPYLVGLIQWHPDNHRAVLALSTLDCGSEGDSALLLLDTDTLTQTVIESSADGYGYGLYVWQDEAWLLFSKPNDSRIWRYNLDTGAIEPYE